LVGQSVVIERDADMSIGVVGGLEVTDAIDARKGGQHDIGNRRSKLIDGLAARGRELENGGGAERDTDRIGLHRILRQRRGAEERIYLILGHFHVH
jgi:hypothetical protein